MHIRSKLRTYYSGHFLEKKSGTLFYMAEGENPNRSQFAVFAKRQRFHLVNKMMNYHPNNLAHPV